MIDFNELPNGKLRLTFSDNDAREEMREYLTTHGIMDTLLYATESYWTNGWGVTSADRLWQMSTAPVIVAEYTIEDDSTQVLNGKAWYFSNYMVENEIETLLDEGFVDFDFWCEFEDESFPPA